MLACSDARHYARIASCVYRFSPMHLSKAERDTIHGNDERISEETLATIVAFYLRLLQMV
jgi:carboxypeptidase PM20D1